MPSVEPFPLSLSRDQQDAFERAARPLDEHQRDAFVAAVFAALERYEELGPGVVHRVIRETQRAFWDPPVISAGKANHFVGRSKLRSGPAVA
jgi:hypothetical protein